MLSDCDRSSERNTKSRRKAPGRMPGPPWRGHSARRLPYPPEVRKLMADCGKLWCERQVSLLNIRPGTMAGRRHRLNVDLDNRWLAA